MNMFKNAGGFTLVELIVVIAILAILAGVAVPAYSGYISEANKTADNQAIEAVNTAIAAALAMEGKNVPDASKYITVTPDTTNDKMTLTPVTLENSVENTVWKNFLQFYGEAAGTTSVEVKFDYFDGAEYKVEEEKNTGVIAGKLPS